MFGLDRFAEKYPAPLADATVKTVDAYFASTKTREPDAAIELAIYDMAADGGPGKVLAKTSLKASELKSNASEYVQTTFEFAEPVALAKGKPFFVAIGPFPYQGVSSYEDQIALYCVTRKQGGLCATWDLAQYSDRQRLRLLLYGYGPSGQLHICSQRHRQYCSLWHYQA